MTARDWFLARAEEIEQHPERWTQGDSAKDAEGNPVCADDREAVCWCLAGLFCRDGMQYADHDGIARRLLDSKKYDCFADFNDAPDRTAADIVDFLRECAEVAG